MKAITSILLFLLLGSSALIAGTLVFPDVSGKIKNTAGIDLTKLEIVVRYLADPGDDEVVKVVFDPTSGDYTVPGHSFIYGTDEHIEGTYLDFHIAAKFNGEFIANMSDIHVFTWERRGYSLETFLQMFKDGASTLEIIRHEKSGELVITGKN
ncbi:hypothetical protein N9O57_00195 [bacterium]|nr:hypothetical protein [bacterium]